MVDGVGRVEQRDSSQVAAVQCFEDVTSYPEYCSLGRMHGRRGMLTAVQAAVSTRWDGWRVDERPAVQELSIEQWDSKWDGTTFQPTGPERAFSVEAWCMLPALNCVESTQRDNDLLNSSLINGANASIGLSLGLRDSWTQTVSRSLQNFLQGSLGDRPTDHATGSFTIGGIYLYVVLRCSLIIIIVAYLGC